MNPAPGISVDFRPCAAWLGTGRLLAIVTAAGLLAWCLTHVASGSDIYRVAPILAIACGGWAGAFRLAKASRSPEGRLLWNCQEWQWLPGTGSAPRWTAAQAGTAAIVLDLGAWILIAFRPMDRQCSTVWLPLHQARAGARWQALQCALRQPAHGRA